MRKENQKETKKRLRSHAKSVIIFRATDFFRCNTIQSQNIPSGVQTGGSCATGRREPCQAGNRAALRGTPRAPQIACPFALPRVCTAVWRRLCIFIASSKKRRRAAKSLPHLSRKEITRPAISAPAERRLIRFVSGPLPQIPAPHLFGRVRAGSYYRDAEKPAQGGPDFSRLSLHRVARHRQDHLCQNPGQGGLLPPSAGGRALQRVRVLSRRGRRQPSGRARNRRCLQQRSGRHPRPAGEGGLYPERGKIPRLYY